MANIIPLPVQEGRDNLWAKTREAFKYIYDNHRDDADWFLKADDDSYVVMENLRSMLHPYTPDMPVYFGRKFKLPSQPPSQGYMSGGAGYVLSKRAMNVLVEDGFPNKTICWPGNGGAEDAELGKCLAQLGVVAGDSREEDGRDRFFPFEISAHLSRPKSKTGYWYYDYCYYDPLDVSNILLEIYIYMFLNKQYIRYTERKRSSSEHSLISLCTPKTFIHLRLSDLSRPNVRSSADFGFDRRGKIHVRRGEVVLGAGQTA